MLKSARKLNALVDARINAVTDAISHTAPPPVFLSIEKALAISIPMQTAVCLSLAFHLALIIGIGFKLVDPQALASPHNILDVVLVNSKTLERPHKAEALAQANLDGGGNTDEKRRAKTPLPAAETVASNEAQAAQERVRQLETEMKQLMTQAKSAAKVIQGEVNEQPSGSPAPVSAAELMQKSIEIAWLEAQISREYEAYQQRPKRKFVGARTTEYRFAQYVDNWRLKIERVGNLNYPEEARLKKIYGTLQLTVAIKRDGDVEGIQINKSSGHKVLDQAAIRIVRLAAPFDRFPENIKHDTDILHITRTWIFTKSDQLTAE